MKMYQPELGRKIAGLRKAKGLTQEELVEKCNLSVRTLQRIEAGEVSPRSYTIRQIFAVLDFQAYESNEITTDGQSERPSVVQQRLEQFYTYFTDLFNLKTNTMKKLMILSMPFLIVLAVLLFTGGDSNAQNKQKIKEKLELNNLNMIKWFNSGAIDSLAGLYMDNASIVAGDGTEVIGKENIKTYYNQLHSSGLRLTENKSNAMVFSESLVVDKGIWKAEGNTTFTGTYITQWKLVNGEWFIENEMSNASVNKP